MSSSIILAKPIALLFLASAALAQITGPPSITSLDFNVVTAWVEYVVEYFSSSMHNQRADRLLARRQTYAIISVLRVSVSFPSISTVMRCTYNEEQQKLWAACYNTAKDVDGNLQLATLPAAYPGNAFKFLAYYAIADSLRYCAGPKTVSSQSVIGEALSFEPTFFGSVGQVTNATVHGVITGINTCIAEGCTDESCR